jgi:hypothetical protein
MPNQVFTDSNNSVHLYRVLEDEYISLYGPLPDEYPWLFLQSHIKDRSGLIHKIKNGNRAVDIYLKDKLDAHCSKQVKKTEAKLADPALKDPTSRTLLADQLKRQHELRV